VVTGDREPTPNAQRGLARVGLPPLDRHWPAPKPWAPSKPWPLWLLQAVLLGNVLLSIAWLLDRVAANDAPRASVLAMCAALIAGGTVVIVAVQRRARWAHAVSCLCAGAISVIGIGQQWQVIGSSRVVQRLLGLDPPPSGQEPSVVGPLLMGAFVLWLVVSPAVRRYFASVPPPVQR
jgi:hypothetical protein